MKRYRSLDEAPSLTSFVAVGCLWTIVGTALRLLALAGVIATVVLTLRVLGVIA